MKLRAEWFWCDRWMGSSGFLLPMEARGLYREMLTQAWLRGARLPADPDAIQRAVGCTREEWDRCWPKVRPYWRKVHDDEGTAWFVNTTQVEIYEEAAAVKDRASTKARRAAQARHRRSSSSAQAEPEHSSSSAQALPEDVPPSPSPSPSHDNVHHQVVAPRNPLVAGRRTELEAELRGHVHVLAEAQGEDPVTVLARLSRNPRDGRSVVNWASMSDDRLAHTLEAARAERRALQPTAPQEPVEEEPGAVRAWEDVLRAVEPKVKPESFSTWLLPTRGIRFEVVEGQKAKRLVVAVPAKEWLSWVPEAYGGLLRRTVGGAGFRLEVVSRS